MRELNPAIALISAFVYSLLVSFSHLEYYFILPIIYLMYLKKGIVVEVFKKLIFLNFFIVVLFLILVLQNSVSLAIEVYLRVNLILLFNLLLFYNSQAYDIVKALLILKFPDKLTSSIYFTIRLINSLTNDFKEIKNTLKSRGFKAKTDMFTYKTYANIIGMLFLNSIQKAQVLEQTFVLRGFEGKIYLNCETTVSKYEYVFLLLVSLLYFLKVLL